MSAQPEAKVISGLEGVLACGSSVCFIDGPAGVLLYRGYAIGDFVEEAEFLDVVWLLWHGDWPDADQSEAFAAEVAARRALPETVAGFLAGAPIDTANPMAVLRTAVSMLGSGGPHRRRHLGGVGGGQGHRSGGPAPDGGGRHVAARARRRSGGAGPGPAPRRQLPLHAHRGAPRRPARLRP